MPRFYANFTAVHFPINSYSLPLRLKFILLCLLTGCFGKGFAQQPPTYDSGKAIIGKISVTGNNKTRLYIILREIQFHTGDSIPITQLAKALELARQQVYNTTLFHTVDVDTVRQPGSVVDVEVKLKERWYIYPVPQFQPVDRNLNEWLVKYKGDLSRVNYGVKFVHFNFTGQRDVLRVYLLNGYTRNISFSYQQPYSSKKLTEGFVFGAGYSQTREVNYGTSVDNKQLLYKPGGFVRNNFVTSLGYSYRKGILGRHLFSISLNHATITDSILRQPYNPTYFGDSSNAIWFTDLSYLFRYINVNNVAYPLKGTTGYVNVLKRGFGWSGQLNLLSVEANWSKYLSLNNKWYAAFQFTGRIKLPFDQPFINQRALGYGENNLRGLDYYVIDGPLFGLAKATLRKEILYFSLPSPFKNKYFNRIPFRFFANAFTDGGYVHHPNPSISMLNNRFLYTSGLGLDIVSLYDFNLRLEYSFNQLGESGVFFQIQGGF